MKTHVAFQVLASCVALSAAQYGLVGHPNGAVVPVDEPAVAAARAEHFAAGGGRGALGYAGVGYAAAPAIPAPAIAAPAIAAPAIATTGVIGGYSTLGGHYYGKREAEAEPYLGYAGLGYGYAGAYGYGKSAPCVNAANFPVPCRGFY